MRRSKHTLAGADPAFVNGRTATARMEYEIYSFRASWSTLFNGFKSPALAMSFESQKELKSGLETLGRKALQKYWLREAKSFT